MPTTVGESHEKLNPISKKSTLKGGEMTRVNRNIVTVLKVLAGGISFLVIYFILTGPAWTQNLELYEPLEAGFCGDVQLNCVKMVLKETEIFYVVFDRGKLIAITRVHDGKETVIWGKLPLRKNEKDI